MKLIDPLKNPGVWQTPSVLVLLLANLVPLAGVVFFGWSVFPVMLLFWLENVVVGVFSVLKLGYCGGGGAQHSIKFVLVPFFCIHYGIFTMVHGVFVFALFGAGQFAPQEAIPNFQQILDFVSRQGLGWPVLALVVSHGFSFVWNYILCGEHRTANVVKLMVQPYGRVLVLHVAVLGSGFLIILIGAPKAGLALLVTLKIALDVLAHAKEHSLGKTKSPAQKTSQPPASLRND